ncbi:MAG: hypothetical protein IID39_07030 [Planctomycetes bacterium]|nr:hypothetical protein [Planctomycetota bacterium]
MSRTFSKRCVLRGVTGTRSFAASRFPHALHTLGYAALGYTHFADLLRVCKELVVECPCVDGRPSWVGLANVRPPLHSDPDLGTGYSIPQQGRHHFHLGKVADVGRRILRYAFRQRSVTRPSQFGSAVMQSNQ